MATITALNVRLGMDATNFSQGADLARAEVNKVASVLRQSVPPAEKFKKDMELLDKAFSDAGKQSKEYGNAVEFLRKKHGQVTPDIKKTSDAVSQLKDSMLSAVPGGSMLATALRGPAGAALALAAAVAIVSREVSKAAQRIDETAKAARGLGVAYSDLVSLQMLAGEVSGIDSASLNKGMGIFVRKLAEARVNGGAVSETMRAIGLDVDKLAGMNPVEAFKQVSDVIGKIPDQAEKVRIAVSLFGREGIKFVDTLMQGSAAVDKMRADIDRLGLSISAEGVASVETMNDAFGRAGKAVEGIWNNVTTALAPTLTNVAKLAEDFFVFVRRTGETFDKFNPVLQVAGFVINKMIDGFRAILALASDIVSLISSIPNLLSGGSIDTSFSESTRLLDEMDAKANGTAAAIKTSAEEAEELAIQAERAAAVAQKINESYEQRIRDMQIESVALAGNVEEAERMRLIAEGYSKTQADTLIKLQQQNAAIKERVDAEKKANDDAKKAAEDATKRAEKAAADREKELERLEQMKEDAFTKDIQHAIDAANKYFELEAEKAKKMREDVSKGPGAGMEEGSAEAVKFMADQVNASIGAAVVPDMPTPGEQEIADKTEELLIEQRESNRKQGEQLEQTKLLLAAYKENGFKRVR